jgi:hypothetical protein
LSAQGPEFDLFRDFPCRENAQLLQHASQLKRCEPLKSNARGAIIFVSRREAPLSETEPIIFSPRKAGGFRGPPPHASQKPDTHKPETRRLTSFDRHELSAILAVYGRKVAAGEWRDYAIDLGRETAVFSIFRRASECPLFRIEKTPRLARKQGAYSVVAPAGLILKRGHDLRRVLNVLEDRARLVAV